MPRTTSALFAFAILVATASPTRADFDPALDFSPMDNPHGVWSYGWTHTLGSAFILDTARQNSSGLDFWEGSVTTEKPPGSFPTIAHNGTDSTINYLGYLPYPSGSLGLHPGPNGQYAVVRFTAAQPMTIRVEGSFFKIDPSATTDVHILDNNIPVFDGAIGASGSAAFSLTRSVGAGETIDFAVGYGSNYTYYSD